MFANVVVHVRNKVHRCTMGLETKAKDPPSVVYLFVHGSFLLFISILLCAENVSFLVKIIDVLGICSILIQLLKRALSVAVMVSV